MENTFNFDTFCVVEYEDQRSTKPHILPIYATSSFEMENMEHGIEIFTGKQRGHVYGRYGNPTIDTTAKKIADLEAYGMEIQPYGFMTSSGMSAIAVLLQSLLSSGDGILTQEDLYGGTTELFHSVFVKMNIQSFYSDLKEADKVEKILQENPQIKVMYLETPSNPTCACLDLAMLSAICKKYNVLTVADNTFCTPYIQQPFKQGIDFIIHSTTKYLNGHGNSIAGVIIGHDEKYRDMIWKTLKLVGSTCNPFDAWLVYNGLKTLGLRMEKHSQNAMALAKYLQGHPKVSKVNYVGLPEHPSHPIALKQMNLFGGMMSFEVKGDNSAVQKVMNNLHLATYAPTLGDVHTLVLHPRSSSHLNVQASVCEKNGITNNLIRVSVGIENEKDIISDFEQALQNV
jgi:methionine-gamma-lyase